MRAVFLTLFILIFAGPAYAPVPTFVGLFAEESSWDCWIDADTNLVDVYVRCEGFGEFTEVSFRIDNNTTLIRLSEECPIGATCVGDSETGITVSMPCANENNGLVLLKVTYIGSGDSPACSRLKIFPPGDTGEWLQFFDCGTVASPADGGWLLIRPDGTTGCTGCDMWTPVENTTWGTIKSLYTDQAPYN